MYTVNIHSFHWRNMLLNLDRKPGNHKAANRNRHGSDCTTVLLDMQHKCCRRKFDMVKVVVCCLFAEEIMCIIILITSMLIALTSNFTKKAST